MKSETGFTIIELMLGITIMGILLAWGVPSFVAMIQNNRLTTEANHFIGDLNYARLEAIKSNDEIVITALNPSSSDEFGEGWVIWRDLDDDGTRDAGEEIRFGQALKGTTTLDSLDDITEIKFKGNGGLNATAARVFALCDDRTAELGRRIRVEVVGRINLKRDYQCP